MHITAVFLIKIAAIAIYITRAHYIVYSEAIYYVVCRMNENNSNDDDVVHGSSVVAF